MTTRNSVARLAAAIFIPLLVPGASLAAQGQSQQQYPAHGLYKAAPALSGGMSAAGVTPGVTYGGMTSDSYPLVIKTSKNGRKIVGVDSQAFLPCSSGKHLPFAEQLTAQGGTSAIGPGSGRIVSGSVSKSGRFTAKILGSIQGDTWVSGVTETISGKLGQKSSSGRMHVNAPIMDTQSNPPKQIDTCDQTVSWKFGPQPLDYGGVTSQHTPVVVEVSKDRRKVKKFGIGWAAPCTSGASMFPGAQFPGFPMSLGGAFSHTFTDNSTSSDGSSTANDVFKIAGHVGRSAGNGSYSFAETDKDKSGATTDSCNASVSWHVTG